MWRGWLMRIAQLLLSLAGALVLASGLAALSHPAHGTWGFISSFLDSFSRVLHGDFGLSAVTAHAATDDVARALPATVQLALAGGAIALVLGIPLGFLLSANRVFGVTAPILEIIASTPVFCAALFLVWLAAQSGSSAFAALLPSLVVGIVGAAAVQLAVRRATDVAVAAPYRTSLRLMGLGAWEIDTHYVLPQTAAGVAEHMGNIVLALLSATAIAEFVFGIHGAALLFFASAAARDWNVAALVLLVFAAAKIIADFVGLVISRSLVTADIQP